MVHSMVCDSAFFLVKVVLPCVVFFVENWAKFRVRVYIVHNCGIDDPFYGGSYPASELLPSGVTYEPL